MSRRNRGGHGPIIFVLLYEYNPYVRFSMTFQPTLGARALASAAALPVHPDRTPARSRRGHPRRPADRSPGTARRRDAPGSARDFRLRSDTARRHGAPCLEAQDMPIEDIGVRPEVL